MTRLIIGVGNRLSRDDGLGPTIAARLCGTDWETIDAGSVPENITGKVKKIHPDLLVIVDAARMGLPPGSIRRLSVDATDRMLASTHGLPLSFLISQLEGSAKRIMLIGVEPQDLSLGEGLSPAANVAVDALVTILSQGRLDEIPELNPGKEGASPPPPRVPR